MVKERNLSQASRPPQAHPMPPGSDEQLWQQLDQFYLDVKQPTAFTSASKLYAAAKHIPGMTLSKVKAYLAKQSAYTRFVTKRRRFPRRAIVAFNLDDIWQV